MASVCIIELRTLEQRQLGVTDCVLLSGLLPVNLTIAAYGAAVILGGSVLGLVLYFLATQVKQKY